MDFWEWLRRITARQEQPQASTYDPVSVGQNLAASISPPVSQGSLREAIQLVLSRNDPGYFRNEIHPTLEGGRLNPVLLDSVTVSAPSYHTLGPSNTITERVAHDVRRNQQSVDEWREDPLISDTLAALFGRPDVKERAFIPYLTRQLPAGASKLTRNALFTDDATRSEYIHEIAHVGDMRDAFPGFEQLVERNWPLQQERYPYPGWFGGEQEERQDRYATKNKHEYYAVLTTEAINTLNEAYNILPNNRSPEELFDRTLELARQDNRLVGLDEAIIIMLQHPIFAQHPYAKILNEREFYRNSTGQNNDQFFLP